MEPTHYVLAERAETYVKEAAFFIEQGGFTEEWGKAWKPVTASSLEEARRIGTSWTERAERLCYIATGLENIAAHRRVRDAMAKLGVGLSYDWTVHGSVKGQGIQRLREVGEAEMRGVMKAAFVVVVLPGGRGTHVELGLALVIAWNSNPRGKVILFSEDDAAFGDSNGTCAFYHLSSVVHVKSLDELIKAVHSDLAIWQRVRP